MRTSKKELEKNIEAINLINQVVGDLITMPQNTISGEYYVEGLENKLILQTASQINKYKEKTGVLPSVGLSEEIIGSKQKNILNFILEDVKTQNFIEENGFFIKSGFNNKRYFLEIFSKDNEKIASISNNENATFFKKFETRDEDEYGNYGMPYSEELEVFNLDYADNGAIVFEFGKRLGEDDPGAFCELWQNIGSVNFYNTEDMNFQFDKYIDYDDNHPKNIDDFNSNCFISQIENDVELIKNIQREMNKNKEKIKKSSKESLDVSLECSLS